MPFVSFEYQMIMTLDNEPFGFGFLGLTLGPIIAKAIGTQIDLDGSQSTDVNADCWKGYTWYFDISGRPITTQDSVIEWSFSNPGSVRPPKVTR